MWIRGDTGTPPTLKPKQARWAEVIFMFKHILLPTDGSEAASRAVQRGVELAVQLGAKVTVMTVIEYFPSGIMGDGYRPDVAEHDVPGYQAALDRLTQAEDVARQAGVAHERVLVRDKPVYRAILEVAQDRGVDLIVMGTRGLGLVERLFIGSETQRVLTHTTLPVLTLH
jgi:nucleotide-binding universal stress UspA family protein